MVAVDIDPLTFEYARTNLENAGYTVIVLIRGDGGFGYPKLQPYDRIAITAACKETPPTVLEQLAVGGKLIAPVIEEEEQNLLLFEKSATGYKRQIVCQVLYVNLRGQYGIVDEAES